MKSDAGIIIPLRATVEKFSVLPASLSFPMAVCLLRVGSRAVARAIANMPWGTWVTLRP